MNVWELMGIDRDQMRPRAASTQMPRPVERSDERAPTPELGDRRIDANGYARIYAEAVDGTVGSWPEHRWVMENVLGRRLRTGENVHHRNGERADNRAENLELWWRPQPSGQRVRDLIEYVIEAQSEELMRRGWTPPLHITDAAQAVGSEK